MSKDSFRGCRMCSCRNRVGSKRKRGADCSREPRFQPFFRYGDVDA